MQNLPLLDFGRPYYITPHAAHFYVDLYQRILQAKADGRDIREVQDTSGGEGILPKSVEGRPGIFLPTGEVSKYGYEQTYDWTWRDGVATIQFIGPVVRRSTWLSSMSGGVSSTATLSLELTQAMEHPLVNNVILLFDSPGGESAGLPELAARIRQLADSSEKKIVAYVDNVCASAAYFLASACSEIVIAPNALVGSIGSVYAFYDDKKAMAAKGMEQIVIRNVQSPKKYLDPTEEAGQEELQRLANESAEIFGQAVATYRDTPIETVWADFGQGSVLTGQNAVNVGMVDRLGDYESLVSELSFEESEPVENNSGGTSFFGSPSQGANMNDNQLIASARALFGLTPATQTAAVEVPEAVATPALPAAAAAVSVPDARDAELESLRAQIAANNQTAANAMREQKMASFEATINEKLPPAARENAMEMARNSFGSDASTAAFESFLSNLPDSTWKQMPAAASASAVFVNPEQNTGIAKQNEQTDSAAKSIVAAANGKRSEHKVDRSLYANAPVGF